MNVIAGRTTVRFIVAVPIFCLLLAGSEIHAQNLVTTRHKFEAHAAISAQRPFYRNSTELAAPPREYRYRAAGEVGLRYYVFRKWYAEYQLAYSPEGGGRAEQYTNANYLKNSLLVGFSASHSRRVIFNVYTGLNMNFLLSARFHALDGRVERVKTYFRPTYSGIPLGLGLKSKVGEVGYVSLDAAVGLGRTDVSRNDNFNSIQIISPVFKLTFSRFL